MSLAALLGLVVESGDPEIESKTSFVRPVTSGKVMFRAQPIHVGRSLIVINMEVSREDGELVALTTQTQAVISRF